MSDKEDFGQYRLFDLTDMEEIPTTEEVRTLLTPGEPMEAGTVQDTIADVEDGVYDEDRYLAEVRGSRYDQFEQDTLPVDVPVETEQAEITDYNQTAV